MANLDLVGLGSFGSYFIVDLLLIIWIDNLDASLLCDDFLISRVSILGVFNNHLDRFVNI